MKGLGSQDPRQLGRNRMVAVIGQGGMGRVLLGESPTGRLLAVKQIHRHLASDPEFHIRFQREVEASRSVTGAYTAAVVDYDADSESPWLATEYIPGPSLNAVIEETGPLSLGGLRLLAAGLASALIEIHRAGLIHRDLKPGNVLLAPEGPRVIDFGIARAVVSDGQLTLTGSVIGSPAFMPPEQAQGHQLTPAADVFSVGAILAFAASGQSPFAGTSTPQVLYSVMNSAPETDRVPEPLRDIVVRCLAKDPKLRPTPEQLLDAAGRIEPDPVWPGAVRDVIADHRADSGWWVATTAKHAKYEAQLDELRTRRKRRIQTLTAAAAALLLLIGIGMTAREWAEQPGHAAPATDLTVSLTGDQWRLLDLCTLLDRSVGGQFGLRSGDMSSTTSGECSVGYADAAGAKRSFKLAIGSTVSVFSDMFIPSGSVAGWMPMYGLFKENDLCARRVFTQTHPVVAIEVTASFRGGDGCKSAEQIMLALVNRLAVNPPQLPLPTNSIRRLDPCAMLSQQLVKAVVGDSRESTGFPYGCQLESDDAYLSVDFSERGRPDKASLSGTQGPSIRVDGVTAFIEDNDATYHTCTLTYMVRPTRDDLAEIVSIRSEVHGQAGSCDRAARVLSAVLPQLPK
ncbi:protein kinase [Nocardia sp. NPDC056000]|uniref:serine/threonine-protein kinase n=1 Tax=Nocardia sp. NPDC056000 TaxID=3345674 RepID=UPI0035DC4A0B